MGNQKANYEIKRIHKVIRIYLRVFKNSEADGRSDPSEPKASESPEEQGLKRPMLGGRFPRDRRSTAMTNHLFMGSCVFGGKLIGGSWQVLVTCVGSEFLAQGSFNTKASCYYF